MRRTAHISSLLILLTIKLFGQNITADFNLPIEVCLEEQFQLQNTSINTTDYEWDFCDLDLQQNPLDYLELLDFGYSNPLSFKVFEENGNYHGFGLGRNDDNLYRFDFGVSITNSPTIVNLGNPSSLFDGPVGLSFFKESGNWFALIVNLDNNNIIRLSFADALSNNIQTAENLGNYGEVQSPDGITIKQSSDGIFAFITNKSRVSKINFGNSILNAGTVTSYNIPLNTRLWGIDITEESGNWYCLVSSFNDHKIYKGSFGNSLVNAPNFDPIDISSLSLTSPADLKFAREGSNYFAFVQFRGGAVARFNFQETLANTPTLENLGSDAIVPTNNNAAFELIEENGVWHGFTASFGSSELFRYRFEKECSSPSTKFSPDENPILSFSESGNYAISLKAYDNAGNFSSIQKSITIKTDQAPAGEISLEPANCIADSITFNFNTTDDIATYNWDFGDGNTSTHSTPKHLYATDNEYSIQLVVETTAGCTNIFYDTLNIFPEPQPEFSTVKTEYCTFESIEFTNSTPFNYGDNASWSWDFNGEGISSLKSPTYVFETPGTKIIMLRVNVLGCIESYQSNLTIIEGPNVAFEYDKNCIGETIQFTNRSTGANIIGYLWDFGNSQTSTLENPQHIYGTSGNYTVSLTVSNSNGCENTSTQNIKIFETIIDSITATNAIENTQFKVGVDWSNAFDSTQILSYQWKIEDLIQTADTAKYTLPQGNYIVDLEIVNQYGCLFSAQRLIEVKASGIPTADFNFPPIVCIGEQFGLGNTSVNSTDYEWNLCTKKLAETPTDFKELQDFGFTNSIGFSLIPDKKIAFIAGRSNNNIYRLLFDDSLKKVESIENLGNIGGVLNGPVGFDFHKENENWYGLMVNLNNNNVIRLSFGNSLLNTPTSEILGDFGIIISPDGIKIVKDEGKIFAFVTNQSRVAKLAFDNSILNMPIASSTLIAGNTRLWGIDLIKEGENWFGLVSSFNEGKIYLLNYGQSLENNFTPIAIDISTLSLTSPAGLQLIKEGDQYYGFVQFRGGNLLRLNFGTVVSSTPLLNNLGKNETIPSTNNAAFGLAIVQDKYRGFTVNFGQGKLFGYSFSKECYVTPTYSTETNPTISYSTSGTYPITLTATHPNGSKASITKEVTVSNNVAPEINLSLSQTEACIGNSINFNANSPESITNWKWSFGNGDSSTVQAPEYTFDSPGTYQIIAQGLAANGCKNIAIQELTIYETPIASLSKSTQGALCSQKPIDFFNTTSLPTAAYFSWDFGDGNFSTEENPTHSFASAGEYIITLNIEMAGCTSSVQDTLQVNPGPNITFQTADQCYGQIIDFINNSSGNFITAYEWDFGDSTTSSLPNPSHQFDTPGEKTILLTAYTSNGCDYTIEQVVDVYPLAIVDFDVEPACNNSAVQFSENVSIQNANVTNYFWDFGLSGSTTDTATEANPSFTYPSAGTFEVRLQVTTEDGCVTNNTKQVVVNEVPNPTITYAANCLGEAFQFTGNANANITNEFWRITDTEINVLASSTATTLNYTFLEPGVYTISYRQQTAQLCSKTVTQSIEVFEKPVAAFSFDNACVGDEVSFENNSILNGNTASDYSWFIDNELVSIQPRLAYQFENSGTYEVKLQLTTANSCMAEVSDFITISKTPSPFFEVSQSIGAAPFSLTTSTNKNTGEVINWYINGQLVSTEASLNSTLDTVGIYQIGLEISNENGCSEIINKQIDIRQPILNISANRLQAVQRDNYTEFILTLSNKGSLVPDHYNINFNLGNYAISERLDAIVLPGNTINERLSIQLSEEQLKGVERVCLEIKPIIGPYEEIIITDNRICVGVSATFNVLNIFPNPSTNNVTIPLILPKASTVEIIVEQSSGQTASKQEYSELSAGYNELLLKRDGLVAGIYILRIRYEGQEKIKKVVFY